MTATKLLGIHFDNQLTWTDHITQIHKKIASNLYLLKNIKDFLPVGAGKLLFNSYVLPHFDYCSIIWGTCSQTTLNQSGKIAKRAVHLILDKDVNTRSHILFRELGWMSLADKIEFKRAVQVHKCLNGTHTQGLDQLFKFNKDVHSQSTRSATKNNLYIAHNHPKSFPTLGP